jgi:hypothetical protein
MEATTPRGSTGPDFVSLETHAPVDRPPSAATLANWEKKCPPHGAPFLPLDRETRAAVDTATAAYHLNRQPQTLRCWSVYGSGPIQAFRVHGRLMWPTAELRKLCGVAA